MAFAVGDIVDGVVSNILKFGAFVNLSEDKSGLVHISELSDSYVENVSDHLEKGQKVKVKILSLDDKGKIALSIKQAKEKTFKPAEVDFTKKSEDESFEDKLSKFLKDSNEKYEQVRSRQNSKMARQKSRNK